MSMKRTDFKYTLEFLNRYGNQVVKALKQRAPVDTGALRADLKFRILYEDTSFNVEFYVDDHITPADSDVKPSVYGNILDESRKTHYRSTENQGRRTQGWFTKPIPGLGERYFVTNLERMMAKDIEVYMAAQARRILLSR